ncbi:N(2)-acetyl-L-2,4-diaminobutanoate deacetylase DoeB [Devosia nitrariae]|uniref:N-alpha-acetyl diaminobutyric acid deacetylase DoeB n=1 Tax=Devosia nitrariae TaxID=2071872 RepID=A0ABQ5W9F5_9HYPH|nr:N(2)-acetyl-L-2,4-diaminobutanoate deacetylase DoeB [Devosia nitrariae]GLQ56482.1 N-alpha-acetyl diaminobutyric acid deacetylase DoeB [Devosia nitrariae]
MKPSPIVPTVDFDAGGVQHGFLRLPWSRDESAWGNLMIPITVVSNGEGPTALLTGASHGDEYEGPVALVDLARSLDPADVSGRVIILPFLNYPAFRAGRRLSPIDAANMNRIFPGQPDGTVSQKIADFVQRQFLPLADVVLDFHSGGKTLDFVPFAAAHALPDQEHEARCHAARDAFGAPYSMTMLEIDAVGMLDTAAEELGKVFVTTELGGAGTATARSIAIAKRGVRNVLIHSGILAGEVVQSPSTRLDMPSADCFVFSETDGLIEPCVDLGDRVAAGDVIARVHSATRTGEAPVDYHARLSGILAARHAPGLIGIGDCLGVVATLV